MSSSSRSAGREASPRREVILGVSGGIAAYKACQLLRLMTEAGLAVTVIPTASSLNFVGAATWEALSGRPVNTLWDNVSSVPHVRLGQQADLVVIAPATADLLARAAHGLADDLLTTTLLMTQAPVLMAPAMHTEMWLHPATAANVRALRDRGVTVLEPAHGRLTGPDTGPGRLPEPEEIFVHVLALLEGAPKNDFAGRRVLISAGGTREPLDPVRFLGNRSSGRQGLALGSAALRRGADVTIVAANVDLPYPAGAKVIEVESSAQLHEAMLEQAPAMDAIFMAAAVADYRPQTLNEHKIKKSDVDPVLALVKNEDTLATLVAQRAAGGVTRKQMIVGFAAETGDSGSTAIEHARAKLQRKGCDLLMFNDVSGAKVFGASQTNATLLTSDGQEMVLGELSKDTLANALLDHVAVRLT
jgi:phosphopantothenoylcysteine decarboxylase / phosphopantothenate---cysteine ligase